MMITPVRSLPCAQCTRDGKEDVLANTRSTAAHTHTHHQPSVIVCIHVVRVLVVHELATRAQCIRRQHHRTGACGAPRAFDLCPPAPFLATAHKWQLYCPPTPPVLLPAGSADKLMSCIATWTEQLAHGSLLTHGSDYFCLPTNLPTHPVAHPPAMLLLECSRMIL